MHLWALCQFFSVKILWGLKARLGYSETVDFLVFRCQPEGISILRSLKYFRSSSLTLVTWGQDFRLFGKSSFFKDQTFKLVKKASKIHVDNEPDEYFLTEAGVSLKDILVCPVNLGFFTTRNISLRRSGLTEDREDVIKFFWNRGYDTSYVRLNKALVFLRSLIDWSGLTVTMTIDLRYGMETDVRLKTLRSSISRLGLENYIFIEFFTKELSAESLRKHDFMLSFTDNDGFPISVGEALTEGLPVIYMRNPVSDWLLTLSDAILIYDPVADGKTEIARLTPIIKEWLRREVKLTPEGQRFMLNRNLKKAIGSFYGH